MCSFIVRKFSSFSNLSVALHNGGRSFFTASVVVTSAAFSRPATIEKKPLILKWHTLNIHSLRDSIRVAHWWDHWAPPTNVAQVRIPATKPYVVYMLLHSRFWRRYATLLCGGAFRDDIKNDGCIADYTIFRSSLLLVLSLVPIEVFLFVIWLCPLHKNQRNTSKFQFDLERTESTRFNELLRTPYRR